jgi:hypothetical protein
MIHAAAALVGRSLFKGSPVAVVLTGDIEAVVDGDDEVVTELALPLVVVLGPISTSLTLHVLVADTELSSNCGGVEGGSLF